jgi:hypothetical protein
MNRLKWCYKSRFYLFLSSFFALSCFATQNIRYESYPTGFYLGLTGSIYYRDMRADSSWRYWYSGPKKYSNPLWGPAADFEFGYQATEHWGVAAQGGWVAAQKVTALSSGPSYTSGDYRRLSTCWVSILLRTRLQMDYRYYFIAEFGPAYVSESMRSNVSALITTSHNNRVLPTAVVGIEYRATESLNVGLHYQVIWGQGTWRNTWAGTDNLYPAIQMLGINISYQFNA